MEVENRNCVLCWTKQSLPGLWKNHLNWENRVTSFACSLEAEILISKLTPAFVFHLTRIQSSTLDLCKAFNFSSLNVIPLQWPPPKEYHTLLRKLSKFPTSSAWCSLHNVILQSNNIAMHQLWFYGYLYGNKLNNFLGTGWTYIESGSSYQRGVMAQWWHICLAYRRSQIQLPTSPVERIRQDSMPNLFDVGTHKEKLLALVTHPGRPKFSGHCRTMTLLPISSSTASSTVVNQDVVEEPANITQREQLSPSKWHFIFISFQLLPWGN